MTLEDMKAHREELEVRLFTSTDDRTKELLTQCIEDYRQTIAKIEGEQA